MADEQQPQTDIHDEPQGTQEETTDWEAKYRDAIAQSRKWEDRAKASYSDTEELKKLKETQAAADQQTAKRIEELERENAAYKSAKQQEEWKAAVSKETGVPAGVLRGTTLEEIQSHAEALQELIHPAPRLPMIADPAKQPSGNIAGEEAKAWVSRLFGETSR